jgi:hypothetical protein
MKNLTKIIRLRGYKLDEFARQILGIKYRAFKTQIDKGTMRYCDIKKVLAELNIKFEDLNSNTFKIASSKIQLPPGAYDLKEIKKEQEWAKIYAHKIKKPQAKELLISIIDREKTQTLKEFCEKYHVTEV